MITPELARELLAYDPETGVLTWKRREMKHFTCLREYSRWNNRYAGRVAGRVAVKEGGYRVVMVSVKHKLYLAHRIIWMIMRGEDPPKEIDHKDRDGANNRWNNLRASNTAMNLKNKTRYHNNTSGITGVYWHRRIEKWQSCISVGGRLKHLGTFDALLDAVAARKSAERRHDFDPGHGQTKTY